MKLKRNMIIAFDPTATHTIGDRTNDDYFAVGVVVGYDKWADCYDIDIGCGRLLACILPNHINPRTVRVINTL